MAPLPGNKCARQTRKEKKKKKSRKRSLNFQVLMQCSAAVVIAEMRTASGGRNRLAGVR
jgi:hypothetical protein